MKVKEYVKDRILTVESVLSKNECKELIERTEKDGYKPSPPSGGGHGQTGRQGLFI
jgi:hypothetical protein